MLVKFAWENIHFKLLQSVKSSQKFGPIGYVATFLRHALQQATQDHELGSFFHEVAAVESCTLLDVLLI